MIQFEVKSRQSAFGVPASKLFRFIVSRRGIELDPSKIKAIQELPPPKTKKEVMSFLGRLNYISRFIAQSSVVCEPIFKLLKKDVSTKWTGECQTAFDAIKNYLSNPPVLVLREKGVCYCYICLSRITHWDACLVNMMRLGRRSEPFIT